MINKFAVENNLPLGGTVSYSTDQGALFSYSPTFVEIGKLAAAMADKILRGIPAGSIPVASPEPQLRINYRRALELGLPVPEGLLYVAKEIIR